MGTCAQLCPPMGGGAEIRHSMNGFDISPVITSTHESVPFQHSVARLYVAPQGRIQDFWKGGGGSRRGYRIFHKHPRKIEKHPLGHCPRDVIRPQKN